MIHRLLPRRRLGWLSVSLTFAILLNALRLRGRLAGLAVLAGGEGDPGVEGSDDFLLVRAAGVEVDTATRRAATIHAEAEGLDVLDLVPRDLPLDQALELARRLDTSTYRSTPFAVGRGAHHAVLVRRDVWIRTQPTDSVDGTADVVVSGQAAFTRLMERLKRHAARSCDLVVVPELHGIDAPLHQRLAHRVALNEALPLLALAIPALGATAFGAAVVVSPGWGVAALGAFVLQAGIVTAAGSLGPTDQPARFALRSLSEPFAWMRSGSARDAMASGVGDAEPIESRRLIYQQLMAGGVDRFFEARRDDCPRCQGTDLRERLRIGDRVQFKPGEFVLDRCQSCGHIFQNPRLSRAGLDFYYRDAYDGKGTRAAEFLFSLAAPTYRGRVDMVSRHVTPQSWLDVGSGYGHFCVHAKGALPDTRFDGLDIGESIGEAERRRWVDHAYRGLFPQLAEELAGAYDVVSMNHYLEHTIDPWSELDAARRVLDPGGHLLVEVPDPESRSARLLGRFWAPWLQPQHLHFLSAANLVDAVERRGFTVVQIERGPAHQPSDLAGAVLMLANTLAPPLGLPWRDPPSVLAQARRVVVLGVAAPFILLATAADQVLLPFITTRVQGWSNTYRILARR